MTFDKLKSLFSQEKTPTTKADLEAARARLWDLRKRIFSKLREIDDAVDELDRLLDRDEER